MTTQLSRSATTRRDTGELTRDQKRQRERNTIIEERLESADGPHKWQKRGVQPAVEPSKPSGFSALMRLAAEIREESNPAVRAKLEARYRTEAAALAELSLDVNETKLRATHAEIASTFGGIATQPLDAAGLTRADWQELHHALLVCRERSCHWFAVSRRFGCERWGESFVTSAEAKPTKAAP